MVWAFVIIGVLIVIGIIGGMGFFGGTENSNTHHPSIVSKFIDWMM